MTPQHVIVLVRKLRWLATSPNPHEAASATAKAQALMDRYRLTDAMRVRPDRERDRHRALADVLNQVAEDLVALKADPWVLLAETERLEVEYLRRLPVAKREERLQALPRVKQVEYRRQFILLRQASRRRRRG